MVDQWVLIFELTFIICFCLGGLETEFSHWLNSIACYGMDKKSIFEVSALLFINNRRGKNEDAQDEWKSTETDTHIPTSVWTQHEEKLMMYNLNQIPWDL